MTAARTSWPAVVAALATGVLAATYVGKLPPALPALSEELGLSLVAAGWIVSIFSVIGARVCLFVGFLVDRPGGVVWLDELHRTECPTLVPAGAHDTGAPPAMARAIHERIRASRMEVFEHASHLSLVEQPEGFRQSVDHFIESIDLGQDIRP